ncbi:alpha/beta hydrolase [Streptomyces sp. NPDC051561]|uniref:alpha/beta hydrolase n=1 Tax=Streptomyces sp. NPDC051561 TaxID=3365658 RepID=UPI0037A01F4C
MNDLAELKQYIVAHARAQHIPAAHYQDTLDRIRTDEDGTPGSWVHELTLEGDRLAARNNLLGAFQQYNLARFPYVNGEARRAALDRCVTTFDRWRRSAPIEISPFTARLPEGEVRCWTTGLDSPTPRPLLVFLGGIVSIKEQWAPLLVQIAELGMAGLVTELPGVGENTLPYDADSWTMLPKLLDAVGAPQDTYAVALSFSGHLALRASLDDSRIKGIVGAGAPVRRFFTDAAWQRRVPRVTLDTLAHLTRTAPADLPAHLAERALDDGRLRAIRAQVGMVASLRDEIIPPEDWNLLRQHVPSLRFIAHDDVHGSPRHLTETSLWTFLTLLRMRGETGPARARLHQALRAERARVRATAAETDPAAATDPAARDAAALAEATA